jgi:hypothetical protein
MKLQDVRSQPTLPPQQPVNKIIPRAAIDIDDGFFLWATNFALLSDAYIDAVAPGAPAGAWAPMYANGGGCHYLKVGHAELRVEYLQPSGWMIELVQSIDYRPDHRILSHILADIPVLCSSVHTAARLAEASFPTAPYLIYWRSVF